MTPLLVHWNGRVRRQGDGENDALTHHVPNPEVDPRHSPDECLARGWTQSENVAGAGKRGVRHERRESATHGATTGRADDDSEAIRCALVRRGKAKRPTHFVEDDSSPRSARTYAADSSALSASPRSAASTPSRTSASSSGCGTNTGGLRAACFGLLDGPDIRQAYPLEVRTSKSVAASMTASSRPDLENKPRGPSGNRTRTPYRAADFKSAAYTFPPRGLLAR